MYKGKEIKIKIRGEEHSYEELMADVVAAKKRGLHNQLAFTPETVLGLLFAINEANVDDDVTNAPYPRLNDDGLSPTHPFVKSTRFTGATSFEEAKLVNAMAVLGEKNGMTNNDIQHLIAPVLRMLKTKSPWTE